MLVLGRAKLGSQDFRFSLFIRVQDLGWQGLG